MNVVSTNADSIGLGLEALDKLDAMYARSLNTMIIYLSVLVVIIAVAFPFLTWFHQRKLFQAEEDRLAHDIAERFDKLEVEAKRLIDDAMQKELRSIEAALGAMRRDVRRRMSFATGGVFFLQAHANVDGGNYVQGMHDLIRAAEHSMEAEDNANLQKCLKGIAEVCLPSLNVSLFSEAPEVSEKLDKMLAQLREANDDGRFTNYIQGIEKELREAKKRPGVSVDPKEVSGGE